MKNNILILGAVVIIVALGITITKAYRKNEKAVDPISTQLQSQPGKAVDTVVVAAPEKNSATEERNKVLARRFYEDVVNKHNLAMVDSYAAPEYVEHQYDTHFAGDLTGTKKAFAAYFKAFPDMHVKVNFMMVEGDLVTTQISTTGTNTGPIYGRKGTGKKIDINGVDIVRFENGKAVEHWGYAEEGKLLSQLGLIGPLIKAGRKEAIEEKKKAGSAVSSNN
jgi:predicted SnoaL-like aldol condensation-catalyzing enzyme